MKRLSHKQELWQISHARHSFAARLRSRKKVRHRQLRGEKKPHHGRKVRPHNRVRLDPPAVFSLAKNYEATVAFVEDLRNVTLREKLPFSIDFTQIEEIGSATALYIAAELDRIRTILHARLRPISLPSWKPEVRRLLTEMGFFKLLKTVRTPPIEKPDPTASLRFIRYTTGVDVRGELASEIRKAIETESGREIGKKNFPFAGATEAITNTRQHAYPDDIPSVVPRIRNRWWMGGSYDRDTARMIVMVYDQGAGIPATLPRTKFLERARRTLPFRRDDGDMIAAAMEVGRTLTGTPGRGRGLDDMRRFIDSSRDGTLRILSGRGEIIYQKGGAMEVKNHRYELGGTMIIWNVAL